MGKADKICAGPKNSYKNLKSALKKKEVGGVRTPQPDYNGLFITPFPVSSCQSFFFSGRNSQNVTVTKKKKPPQNTCYFLSLLERGQRGLGVSPGARGWLWGEVLPPIFRGEPPSAVPWACLSSSLTWVSSKCGVIPILFPLPHLHLDGWESWFLGQ